MSLNTAIVSIILGGLLSGYIFKRIKMPAVLGMVIFGIILGSFVPLKTPDTLWEISPFLKSFALTVILLRAGLGIKIETLRKMGLSAALMAFVPCLIEGSALTVVIHFIFGFSFEIAALTGFMLSAVSPAVIVPSMLEIKAEGLGKKNEVPTLVLAGASADDVLAITLFSVFLRLATNSSSNALSPIFSIPLAFVLGIIPGVIVGFILLGIFAKFVKSIRATEKALLLLTIALLLVQVGDILHSAALLGIMAMGLILLEKAENIAHEISSKLTKIWVFAEIVLFVLIGMSLDISVALDAGLKGILAISIGLVFRSLAVMLSLIPSTLNLKEKLFCVVAYIPKATVQAALGSVALTMGIAEGKTILALAVLSIVLTAPLGLIGIKTLSPKLLEEEKDSQSA